MSLTPAFEIGIWNAWWFMSVFLIQWLVVILLGEKISARTGQAPDTEGSRSGRRLGTAAMLTWVTATIYAVFLPFYTGTAWFYAGLALFIAGIIILVLGTLTISRTATDRPFTDNVYRFSRHPGYLSMFLIYLGVSIAAASWLFFLITVITIILQRGFAVREEKYCLKKFGDSYAEYMSRTRRWLGIPKPG